MGEPILYRDHRGGLSESMETVQTVKTVEDIKKHLHNTLSFVLCGQEIESINFDHLGFDKRIDWDTYAVMIKYKGVDGKFVAGMTNGIPSNEKERDIADDQQINENIQ